MGQRLANESEIPVTVENIGGIERASLVLHDGINVFYGENASNRSSLFSAIAGALGARVPEPKTDADEGRVKLVVNDEEYTVEIDRTDGTTTVQSRTLTDQTDICDQFVRLLEDNPLRESVERMDETELYEQLMKPVDTDQIDVEIKQVKRDRAETEETLQHYDELEKRLPELRSKRSELRNNLDDVVETIEETRAEIESLDDERDGRDDDVLEQLEARRSDYRDVANTVETQRQVLESYRDEIKTVESDLKDKTGDVDPKDETELEARIDDLRSRKRTIDSTIQLLQTIVDASRKTLSRDEITLPKADDADDAEHLTDALHRDDEVDCLMCGGTVTEDVINEQVKHLQDAVAEKRRTRDDIENEIDELQTTLQRRREQKRDIKRLRERMRTLKNEIEGTKSTIDQLESQQRDLESEIESLEAKAADVEDETDNAYVELHERVNELTYERGQIESQIEDIEAKIEDITETVSDRESLETGYDELNDRLEQLRTRIYDIECETVDTINTVMAEVIDELAYDNIKRVWVERKVGEYTTGRADGFVLHVVRTTEDGQAYEDTIRTLSTSEREVIGIVLAVAGYIVHDVRESIPFILLDAIESIDAERTNKLTSYLSEHTDYLLVTAHPEDSGAFPDGIRQLHIEDVLV
ncbi:archaea-specific SMC-related protein [Halorubrum vacuolatum]|uniref:AAA domain-containing protein n=1 Tax=Halorubrum vacuolatum TaxID=63740 RepID=A0A238YIL5_HALVU|nr:archaea-specific SMC-related protein [Halorubrum vacuolatum]SNR70812.1 AAA domain-containing protein [Halorubrum vacuolatum]